MQIDVHTHFFPPEYVAEVEAHPGAASVTTDAQGRRLLHYAGDYNVVVGGHVDIDVRLRAMDAAGIDQQVLTMTTPGTHVEQTRRGVRLARLVNEALAEVGRRYPQRFAALATLPLQSVRASVRELEYAVTSLGLRGAMLFSNVNGTPLWDRRFWPLYAKAEELDVPLLIHPTTPGHFRGADPYRLVPLIWFCADTAAAAAGLVLAGVYEDFPRLKIVLGHLGGVLPYLAERVERGWTAYEECRRHVRRTPVEHFKRMYYDTVNFDPLALRLAYDWAGPSRLLLGSDYPHQIGDLNRCAPAIASLRIPERAKRQILGENARALFRLA
jgi:aminocarboxymuconate-semialdehyde decarboxylase